MIIIVVDNDKEVQMAITHIMLRHIVPDVCEDRIYCYRNGEIGYKATNIGSICDLLIVDCGMETEGGLELIRKIKGNGKLKKIPILAISGFPTDEKEAREAGANDFILKPYDLDNFVSKIKTLLKIKNT
jgi:DNA-binding response OmpR family regulator